MGEGGGWEGKGGGQGGGGGSGVWRRWRLKSTGPCEQRPHWRAFGNCRLSSCFFATTSWGRLGNFYVHFKDTAA